MVLLTHNRARRWSLCDELCIGRLVCIGSQGFGRKFREHREQLALVQRVFGCRADAHRDETFRLKKIRQHYRNIVNRHSFCEVFNQRELHRAASHVVAGEVVAS